MSGRKLRTLELLDFDEKSTFIVFALFGHIKRAVRRVGIASELWVDCDARLIIIFANSTNMLDSLTQTQRDIAQKGASSASKSILPAVTLRLWHRLTSTTEKPAAPVQPYLVNQVVLPLASPARVKSRYIHPGSTAILNLVQLLNLVILIVLEYTAVSGYLEVPGI